MIAHTFPIRLIPVIELFPHQYAGLLDLKAICTNSYLFEIETLQTTHLELIMPQLIEVNLDDHFTLMDILADMNEYAPLIAGGFLLEINHEYKSIPGCCCGLEAIAEWQNLQLGKGSIWNGHDCDSICYFKQNEQITLFINDNLSYTLTIGEFEQVVAQATSILLGFIEKSALIINKKFSIANGYELVKTMIFR